MVEFEESVRVQRHSVERRQALLDAAEELLGQQDYWATTLKVMGERAGIPTAPLYHYFFAAPIGRARA